jgi:gliding motility-associated-like protein
MSDYNMLYTSGAVLVQRGTPAGSYANLAAWRTASNNDKWSIVYEPAFVSNNDPRPDLANPDVWAMHGRGVQITGNSFDINGAYRPQTLTEGVPDLGAYEFKPTAQPTLLTGTPAVPAANTTQVFMYGTDTVMKLAWKATNFPSSINIQRYSGVVPENPPPYPSGTDSMYFYNKVTVPGGASTTYEYDMNQFYIDPWQGSIPDQFMIGLGRRTPGNSWVVGFSSRVNVPKKEIYQVNMQTPMIEYTGFINPYAPPVLPDKDSSNRGRRFWVAYGHHQQMNNTTGGTQEMRLYLSAQQATNVQVKIYGTATPWVRNYSIPANTAIISDLIPKIGPDDAKITNEGLWNQGISITSEEPIEAYAHTYAATNSGASLLLPVGVWGYEYYSLNSSQYYASDCYSWVYVIADNDNTRVEITPSVLTRGGQPAGVPFQVTLNKGQLYMVMGTTSGATGSDITGTLIKSIPNTAGDCFPIGVFSGSSRTAICYNTNGDNYNQQVFPYSAWGKKYATFATANNTSATNYNSNIFRVMVKDPATTVTVNGTPITAAPWNATLIDNRYYQFGTPNGPGAGAAVYIEANQPVMVGQFMMSSGGNQCPGFTAPGDGDPEMMYISPIEQSINKAVFYTTIQNTINTNYINIVIPAAGLPSLKIDGVTPVFTHVFDHPALPGYKCVRHNLPATNAQHSVESDFPFTAITYGLGGAESYGYNTGTLVRTLNAKGSIDNWPPNTTGGPNDFTCLGTPFIFTAYLPVPATSLTWKFGSVANLTPGTDTTLTNPTPSGTTVINGVTYYVYQLATQYTFSATGIYPVQMVYSHPDIESCDHTATDVMYVQVVPAPKTNFSIAFSGCEGDVATFTGENTSASGAIPISAWEWTFHNSSTASGQNTTFTYTTPGTFNVNLHTVTPDGCIADSVKQVVVNPRPTASVVTDSIAVCSGDNAVFNIQSPLAGATYNWYTTATGGVPLTTGGNIVIGASGTTFTVQNVTAPAEYFVEGVSSAGCASLTRVRIKVDMKGALPAPVVTVGASTANSVTFNWTAVPGAVGYEVSVGGGAFVTPSSGATGTTHTVTGLSTLAQTCIVVRALGALACQNSVSASVCGCANSAPVVVTPIVSVCTGTNATFTIQSPAAGVTYNWYSAATGGTLLGTGSTFNSPTVTGTTNYYVEQVVTATGCVGAPRTQVTANILPPLVPPVIVSPVAPADITVNSIKFTWAAVPGAATYQVSVNGSAIWITPSSGATGLTHTVTGLTPGQQACIKVRALGTIACQTSESAEVCDRAKSDLIFIPNTFSPNGDGKNEILSAYGWAIQTIQFMVFNQWGEKIHEVTTSAQGPSAGFTLWDGKTDGKVQPVGVYVYAAKITLKDGTVVNKSGALNIVR